MREIIERIRAVDIVDRKDIWDKVSSGTIEVLSRIGHRRYPVSRVHRYHNGYRVVYPDGKVAKIKEGKMLDVVESDQNRPKYQFQLSRYGDEWINYDLDDNGSNELDELIDTGNDLECQNGRYRYRIIDSDGHVVWTRIQFTQSVDTTDQSYHWLEAFRYIHSINPDNFTAALIHWLQVYGVDVEQAKLDNPIIWG